MPTRDEFEELIDYTIQSWTPVGRVEGMQFVSETNSPEYTFFPAMGHYLNGSVDGVRTGADLWSSTWTSWDPYEDKQAYYLMLYRYGSYTCEVRYDSCRLGLGVRAVLDPIP